MNDVVVVFRTDTGEDLLAIIRGEFDNRVRVESPYFIRFNPATSNVAMVPFCPLSDERFFEFRKDKIQFLVTANREISLKFLRMIGANNMPVAVAEPVIDQSDEEDLSEYPSSNSTFIQGTDTKH